MKKEKKKFLRRLYFQLVSTRNSFLFKLLMFLYTQFLKMMWVLVLIAMIVLLINKSFQLSLLFFLIMIIFILLDKYFSILRLDVAIYDIENILKILKAKKIKDIPFKIKENLINDINEFIIYEINPRDKHSIDLLEMLVIYLKNFVIYKDYQDKRNLESTIIFLRGLLQIFNNKNFSQIPHLIEKDFDNLRSRKDYCTVISSIKYLKGGFKPRKNIFEMMDSFRNKGIELKQVWAFIINLFKFLQEYKIAIMVLMGIILFIQVLMGKITLDSLSKFLSSLKDLGKS